MNTLHDRTLYRLEKYLYGVLVYEPISASEVLAFVKIFKGLYNYDMLDGKISGHFRASFCITNKEMSELWREQLKINNDKIDNFSKDVW